MKDKIKDSCVDHEKYLLCILQKRIYSRKQLEDKLHRRDCPQEEVEILLDRFEQAGYIDDKAYSILFVDSHPDWASRRLKDELRARGVEGCYVKIALADTQIDDEERATRLAMDWARSGLEERKIYGRLARRGFFTGLCRRVSERAIEAFPPV